MRPGKDAARLAGRGRHRDVCSQRAPVIAITAGGGAIAAAAVGMTPEADTSSGGNAVYVFALPH